ncbi:YncE family protein [Duganella sp. BJB1802]|uniref:YncE family protein n=1 Tax=Duganella sp. BJB1802 TaxID=2744575 RepID=UPI0015945D78|nr:YncE family protein [Duganella sp. BJB1802]NVD71847.1 YncE family protein [Duganella sp. BJB1802]
MKTTISGTMLSLGLLLAAALPAAHAADYAVRQTWTLDQAGRWDYLEVDPVRHRLFVTRGDRVQVLDLSSGKVAGQIGGLQRAHGVAFAQKLNLGFASSGGGNSVVVFDLATLQTRQEVKVAGQNPDAILFEEGSGKLYTFNGKTNNVSVFDAASMAPKATIEVGGKPEFAVTDGKRIYVNIEDKAEIAVIDIATDRQVARWPLAGCEEPTGLALDAAHRRLFSACQNGVLAVTDAASGKAVARAAIGKGSDAVVFDAASATVFSSNGDGTLSMIHQDDADHYAKAATLRTEKGARTMAMDHDGGAVYLPTVVDKHFTVIVATP